MTGRTLQSVNLERQPESADRDAPVRLAGPMSKLRMAELQLMLQHLDAKSKLKAARCSRWLLHVASDSSAWLGTAPIGINVRTCARLADLIDESSLTDARRPDLSPRRLDVFKSHGSQRHVGRSAAARDDLRVRSPIADVAAVDVKAAHARPPAAFLAAAAAQAACPAHFGSPHVSPRLQLELAVRPHSLTELMSSGIDEVNKNGANYI